MKKYIVNSERNGTQVILLDDEDYKKLKSDNYITIFYAVNYLSDNTWSNNREFLINLIRILKDECSYSYYNKLKELIKSRIRDAYWEV